MSMSRSPEHDEVPSDSKADEITLKVETKNTELPTTESRGRKEVNESNEEASRSSSAASSNTSSRSNSSSRPKRYICAECYKGYSRPSLLQQHMLSHSGEKPFECEECGDAFTRKDHLNRHKLKHISGEEKPFHCGQCGKGCSTTQHLKRHERVHEKSHKCQQCDESFFKHQTLRHHINSIHLKSRLVCPYCNKEFTRPYRLENHKLKQHNESPGYQCTFPGCFKNFKTWSGLTLHTKSDHPKLECKICGKKCIGVSGIEMHMKIHEDHLSSVSNVVRESGQLTPPLSVDGDINEARHVVAISETDTALKRALTSAAQIPVPTAKRRKTYAIPELPVDDLTGMISKNHEQRTIPCKYKNCHRLFKKNFDLERHLKWHSAVDKREPE